MRPVVSVTHGDVALSGRMTRAEFDVVLAAIAEHGKVVSGGLLVRDTETRVEIEPGCCVGLETWRDWRGLPDGTTPWLGHDPWPEVRFGDGIVRIWPDPCRTDGPACVIPLAELPGHLAGVRQDLVEFLDLVRQWAPDGLADRFDGYFHISAPL